MAETRDVYREKPLPLKVGILMDMPERINTFAFPAYELVRERFLASGRFERDIQFVTRMVYGAPTGYIQDTIDGYNELCDAGCLVVVGPNHSDNNVALVSTVEQRKVPTVMLGATADNLAEHVFTIPWASIPDDAYVMTSWLKQNGHKRVAMTWDMVWHGLEYVRHFRIATQRAGIEIVADYRFSVFSSDERHEKMKQIAAQHRDLKPDAIVHFGTGNSSVPYARAVREIGWDIPRITNGGFFQANFEYAWVDMEGWVGTSLWDDENETLARWWDIYKARYPEDAVIAYTPEPIALWHDAMSVALEAFILAPIMTPAGVKEGLESIRAMPAAVGGPRQSISFGRYDRRGNKGADVVVLRRCKDGRLHQEGRFQPLV
ncbi:ABC-type branched-chain amino acid transport system, substrate-binding protein [Sphingobium faniae]|nr:ABC-type branched-chain amino acid transport system, substrate-binding protein [Sphingobium faniae]